MRFLALASLAAVTGAVAAIPPGPTHFVTDNAGFLSPPTQERLERRLAAYQQATGHQVIVWIGDRLGSQSLEDFAARAFSAWGVGRKGKDDGVALFVFAGDRKARIEVGYGLEGQLTDLLASRIIREEMVPRLQRGDRDGAIEAAVGRILVTLGGEPGAPPPPAGDGQPQRAPLGLGQLLVLGILAVLFIGLLVTHPSMAAYLLFSIASGGRGGGRSDGGGGGWGGGGGGGFSGGGGSSGGGGASGSW